MNDELQIKRVEDQVVLEVGGKTVRLTAEDAIRASMELSHQADKILQNSMDDKGYIRHNE